MSIVLAIIILILGFGIIMFNVTRKKMKYRIRNNLPLPKPAFSIMKIILTLKNNSEKINKILKLSGLEENMQVLDYGCGIGSYSIESAKIVGKSGKVTGADISPVMIKKIESKVQKSKLTNVDTVLIKEPDDIKNRNFDFILLIDVIHLINDKIKVIKELLSKLDTKGKLLIKFEHLNKSEIDQIMGSVNGISKTNLIEKFWILQKHCE